MVSLAAGSDTAEIVVTVGVDTHADVHVAVALNQLGRRLGELSVPTTETGNARLVTWAKALGTVDKVGLEGTGFYGAGLARHLRAADLEVVEVIRGNRQTRRRVGKTDAIDAETAARTVQAGEAAWAPKANDGTVEMIRALRVARRSAIKARTQAANQLRSVLITAPQQMRDKTRKFSLAQLVDSAARFRPGALTTPQAASKLALKSLANRYQQLTVEIKALDGHIDELARQACPELMAIKGVGTDIGAALLTAAGDNPERLGSEASFAHLCGVAPIPASSGKTNRHRLNRGGNRDANRALYLLAVGRLSHDQPTREYVERRITEGKTKTEAIRCLKRYLARTVFKALTGAASAVSKPAPASVEQPSELDREPVSLRNGSHRVPNDSPPSIASELPDPIPQIAPVDVSELCA